MNTAVRTRLLPYFSRYLVTSEGAHRKPDQRDLLEIELLQQLVEIGSERVGIVADAKFNSTRTPKPRRSYVLPVITRGPPRLPRPATPQPSLRTPPEPGITSPNSGFTMSHGQTQVRYLVGSSCLQFGRSACECPVFGSAPGRPPSMIPSPEPSYSGVIWLNTCSACCCWSTASPCEAALWNCRACALYSTRAMTSTSGSSKPPTYTRCVHTSSPERSSSMWGLT
jgi:hypothetical protein